MAKGWCSGHYQRWRISGDPRAGVPLRPSRRRIEDFGTCGVDGCDRPARVAKAQLCGRHYQRLRKYGDADAPYSRHTRDRFTTEAGYVRVRTGTNEFEFEHRLVMTETLGRPLLPTENVHHLNGDRADNDPRNLELWVRSQPPGHRVSDAVKHAYSVLLRYAPHLLAPGGDA